MVRIQELTAATPASRVRYVDLLRAVAIMAVVTGHWLVIAVEPDPAGRLSGFSALGVLDWSHPLTWLFQVMPVFFMVGGFANAASLAAHRRRGGDAAGWLLDRSARLIRPTTVLLLVLAAGAAAAGLLAVPADQIGLAVWLASLPLWFLVVYLGMIALTPIMYRLHQRAGLAVPLLLLLPVAAGDWLRLYHHADTWAYGSFLFGWLAIHQIGFCWRDGRLPNRPALAAALLAGGASALVLLTYLGPYPISMVTVPGETIQNSSPPSIALIALATTQLGLAMLLRNPSERWLQRPRPWTAVVAVNSVILTIFLWHLAAVVVTALALHRLGLLPTPPVGSANWLLWQLPWLALLAVALAGLVGLFGRAEARAGQAAPGGRLVRAAAGWPARLRLLPAAIAGYAGALGGLLWLAAAGDRDHGPFALPTGALLLYLGGAGVLRLARSARAERPG